jgi:hypothetical protein
MSEKPHEMLYDVQWGILAVVAVCLILLIA